MGSFAEVRNALDGWFSYRRTIRPDVYTIMTRRKEIRQ